MADCWLSAWGIPLLDGYLCAKNLIGINSVEDLDPAASTSMAFGQ